MLVFFFFQAEDGIRDLTVTGVQTCALPLAQSGQPVSLQSGNAGIDSNGNGDTAGDRASVNPFASGLAGSDVFALCELPNGTVGQSNGGPGAFNVATGVASGGGWLDSSGPTGNTFFPAIGYSPVNLN